MEFERFLQQFGASPADIKHHNRYCSIGLSRRGGEPVVDQVFLAYGVLAVEGDNMFSLCVSKSRSGRCAAEPNARVVALHYGNGTARFPRCRLLAILATTTILKGTRVVLCRRSVERCVDEAKWYSEVYATGDAFDAHGTVTISRWPAGVDYYHGVGERHRDTNPQVGFPLNLVELTPCEEIGPGELGLRAKRHIPCGTTFLYTGPLHGPQEDLPAAASGSAPLIDPQFVYALATDKETSCYGQGLARYINHRYNLRRKGNVELVSVVVPGLPRETTRRRRGEEVEDENSGVGTELTSSSLLSQKESSRRRSFFLQDDGHFASLPFFVVTSIIEPGEQLLVGTYGEQYDSRLEREVMCGGFIRPYRAELLLRGPRPRPVIPPPPGTYEGDYRSALVPNDIVWRPLTGVIENDLFLVVEVSDDNKGALLTPLTIAPEYTSKSSLTKNLCAVQGKTIFTAASASMCVSCLGEGRPTNGLKVWIAMTDTVGLLQEGTDYTVVSKSASKAEVVVAIDVRRLRDEAISWVEPRLFEPLVDGSVLWRSVVAGARARKKKRCA